MPVANRHTDLRDLLIHFESMDELRHIKGADTNMEIATLSEEIFRQNPGTAPALMFEDIPGYDERFRVLSGASNSRLRLARILGFPEPQCDMDIVSAYRDRMQTTHETIPPIEVSSGPIMENIDREGEVNLWKFPVPLQHEKDGGRYIGTDCVVIMKDPDTGWVNCAAYRVMVHDENTCGIWIGPSHHGRLIREKYFAQGKPCPVLVSCGQDPLLFLAAGSEVEEGLSEFDYAGGHRGKPFEIISSEIHGLPVPAFSEIVLEGEIMPDETRIEGPFGGFMGYYAAPASQQPVMRVQQVYYRDDPILMLAIPSVPPSNYSYSRSVVKSAMIWGEVEQMGIKGVEGVWCHEVGAGRLFNVISIKPQHVSHSKEAGHAAATCTSGKYAGRWVIIVDEDIDPSNLQDVIWAISTRCDPAENIEFLKDFQTSPADPVAVGPDYKNSRAIIDATRPFGEDFPAVIETSPEMKAQVRKKWPDLF